jgi:L-lactate dehydrogenase complex protein LldF
MLVGLKQAKDLPHASSLCGACREVCPVKINIPHMLLHLRRKLAESPAPEERAATLGERWMARGYAWLMSHPRLLSVTHWLGRNLQRPVAKAGKIRKAPLPLLSRWTRARDLPALPPRTFHQIWRKDFSREPDGEA